MRMFTPFICYKNFIYTDFYKVSTGLLKISITYRLNERYKITCYLFGY